MLDSFSNCWNRVLLRCPQLSPKLSEDFVRNAFRKLAEGRRWSWLVGFNQFITPAVYSTGTLTLTQNSTTVTGSGTTFTSQMIGRQLRVGLAAPIYTIAQYISPTHVELDFPWGSTTASAQPYSIYQCYFTPPSDFEEFICLWDPAFNWQLYLDVQQSEINIWDAQRANVGNAYLVSFLRNSQSQVGLVASPLAVVGTGNAPVSGGVYLAPSDSIFTVEITTGGAPGTAVFKWKKDGGTYTTTVLTDAVGAAQALQDGVVIAFPTGLNYTLGDVFIIQCSAIPNAGVPMYELWPHQQAQKVYPFLYKKRATDLSDVGAVLPRTIPGNVLVEMAMEDVCLWPGPSKDKPNPYYSIRNAEYHGARAAGMINAAELKDNDIWQQDLSYAYPAMSWAMCTPLGDSAWLQGHAV